MVASGCGEKPTVPPPAYESAVRTRWEFLATKVPALTPIQPAQESSELPLEGPFSTIDTALSPQSRFRPIAKEELLQKGDAAISLLLAYSASEDQEPDKRLFALSLLGELSSESAALALLEIAENDKDPLRRLFAADALGKMQQSWVIPRLILRLKNEIDPRTTLFAANSLAMLGIFSHADVFFKDEGFRAAPEKVLEQIPNGEFYSSIENFVAQLRSADFQDEEQESILLAKTLSEHWRQRDELPFPAVPQENRFEREILRYVQQLANYQLREVDEARYALERLGKTAVPSLLRGLRDENPYIRSHCLEVLGRMGIHGRGAESAIVEIAKDPAHRPPAILTLGKIGASHSLPIMLQALEEPSREVQFAAVQALGLLGAPSAVEPLAAKAKSWENDFELWVTSCGMLVQLGQHEYFCPTARAINDARIDQDLLWSWLEKGPLSLADLSLEEKLQRVEEFCK